MTAPITISTTEFQNGIGRYLDEAQRRPVVILKRKRLFAVLISAAEWDASPLPEARAAEAVVASCSPPTATRGQPVVASVRSGPVTVPGASGAAAAPAPLGPAVAAPSGAVAASYEPVAAEASPAPPSPLPVQAVAAASCELPAAAVSAAARPRPKQRGDPDRPVTAAEIAAAIEQRMPGWVKVGGQLWPDDAIELAVRETRGLRGG